MLTALTVKKHERRKGMKGLVDRLKRFGAGRAGDAAGWGEVRGDSRRRPPAGDPGTAGEGIGAGAGDRRRGAGKAGHRHPETDRWRGCDFRNGGPLRPVAGGNSAGVRCGEAEAGL